MPLSAYQTPGVFVEEVPGQHTITAAGTSTAAFVGHAPDARAHLNEAVAIDSWTKFRREFAAADNLQSTWLSHAVYGFFENGGGRCFVVNMPDGDAVAGGVQPRSGLNLLEEIDEVSIVAAPGLSDPLSHAALMAHCKKMGNRVAICDPPLDVPNTELLKIVETAAIPAKGKDKDKGAGSASASDVSPKPGGGLRPPTEASGLATLYFPWLYVADALNPKGDLVAVPPSGIVAGMWAKSDGTRGVQKACANMIPIGALNLTYRVTGAEQAGLNSMGINCFRWFPTEGIVLWGARTLADQDSQWRYLNVRRLIIMIEESIKRATGWVVFEPNDRTLWKNIRSEITGFLTPVWRDGALFGATAEEAFFVKCDDETNSEETINMGQVVTIVGLRPVKPAEFIIFRITQFEGGSEVKTL
jgi:phage tail sheath protein FI